MAFLGSSQYAKFHSTLTRWRIITSGIKCAFSNRVGSGLGSPWFRPVMDRAKEFEAQAWPLRGLQESHIRPVFDLTGLDRTKYFSKVESSPSSLPDYSVPPPEPDWSNHSEPWLYRLVLAVQFTLQICSRPQSFFLSISLYAVLLLKVCSTLTFSSKSKLIHGCEHRSNLCG